MVKNILIAICIILAFLATGELIARVFFYGKTLTHKDLAGTPRYVINGEKTNDAKIFTPDDTFAFKMRDNEKINFVDTSCKLNFNFRTNSLGYRFAESGITDRTKPVIMVLGDSVAFGQGIDDGYTFSDVLDNLFHGEKRVLNFGVGGWGFAEYYLAYKKYGPLFHPQLVIIAVFTANDFNDLLNSSWQGKDMAWFPKKLSRKDYYFDKAGRFAIPDYRYPFLRNSHLWLLLCKAWRNIHYKLETKETISLAGKLIAYIQSDAPTLVVLIPAQYQYNRYYFEAGVSRFKELLSSRQIPCIDFYPLFKEKERHKSYYLDGSHLTVEGNAFVAKTIFEYLADNKLEKKYETF